MSRLFITCQSIGASPLVSALPMTIQGWFPLGLTDLISLQSQGLSRVFLVVDQLLSHVELFVTPGTAAHWFPCPSPSPEACSNSCPLSWWCHPAILSSVIPFSSCFQSFPASGSFPMSWLFTSGCQSIGASSSASVLPMNIQSWFPLGLTDLISLQYKGLSRIFSITTVQKHQFFGIQLFLWSNSHIHTLTYLFSILQKTIALTRRTFVSKITSLLF